MAPVDALMLHGHEHAIRFNSSPTFFRNFCRCCGSVAPGAPFAGSIFLPADNVDDDPRIPIFLDLKAAWFESRDALPPFTEQQPTPCQALIPSRSSPVGQISRYKC